MSDELTVIDLSSYDIGVTDPACLKAHGIESVILSPYSRVNPPHQMADLGDLCLRAGLRVHSLYGFAYFGHAGAAQRDTEWNLELARYFKTDHIWVDCETDAYLNGWIAPVPTPAGRNAELADVLNLIRSHDQIPGIYTFEGWWRSAHNNSGTFRTQGIPLWHANFGQNNPPQVPIRQVSYAGGWDVAIHQATSVWGQLDPAEPNRCGRGPRDANYNFMPEDDMADPNLLISIWCTNEEIIQLRAGQITQAQAAETAKWRMDDHLANTDSPGAIADTLYSHLAANHTPGDGSAVLVPHTHTNANSGPPIIL